MYLINWNSIIMIFATIVSALAAGIIAFATWKYTNYSKNNLEEIMKQNRYFKEKDKIDYVLSRKKIGKDILIELNFNELLLNEIKEDFNSFKKYIEESQKQNFLIKYKKRFSEGYYFNFKTLYMENSFNKLLKEEIEFKDNELTFEIKDFYDLCKSIGRTISFFDIKIEMILINKKNINNAKLVEQINDIKRLENKINKALDLLNRLYEKLKIELDYDFKKSKYYRKYITTNEFIDSLKKNN